MAFDAFLNISTIPGESTDAGHTDWIELLSYNHGIAQSTSGSVSSGGGRTAERCDHGTFQVIKAIDKATPKLYFACSSGEHISEVKLEVCRSGVDKILYYEVTMAGVTVNSVDSAAQAKGAGAAPIPTEAVTFAYQKITWNYIETDKITGQPAGNVENFWDLMSNTGG
jgi:type VI secretion system secreted protein Hcp